MTPISASVNGQDDAALQSLGTNQPVSAQKWPGRIAEITNKLATYLPGVAPTAFTYTRNLNVAARAAGGWGKAAVSIFLTLLRLKSTVLCSCQLSALTILLGTFRPQSAE